MGGKEAAKMRKIYKTITGVRGPLVFLTRTHPVAYGELVSFRLPGGEEKRGQVLDSSDALVVIQVFEGTENIDQHTCATFLGTTFLLPLSPEIVGRVFNGSGIPLDEGPPPLAALKRDINGASINPASRDAPREFIQTGISTIDGMNTVIRGQKIPLFSGAGLPHNEVALQIARQAAVRGAHEPFAVIFAAMGITHEESNSFVENLRGTGALERAVVFLNLANDPTIERLITPRLALTAAEYMAFDLDMHVLVILTDMTNYCEALREIGAAREEVPGRRGYPGYMYTDLASLFERAGRIQGKRGSITQIPILTMPGDDITHPIPDLTGYITEGQIVLSRDLHRKGIYPPINVLPSLSRLMNLGIGERYTREDHRAVSSQCYACYAEGMELRSLAAIIGKESLQERDLFYLAFADAFEEEFVQQGVNENRPVEDTLDKGWRLLSIMPRSLLTRIDRALLEKYFGGEAA